MSEARIVAMVVLAIVSLICVLIGSEPSTKAARLFYIAAAICAAPAVVALFITAVAG